MSQLFKSGREGFLDGTINWKTGDQRVMLVKTSYIFNASHKFLSDITAKNDNGRSNSLTDKTCTDGIADAADTSLFTIASESSNALVIFQYKGADTNSRLIAYINTSSTGLSIIPSAGKVFNIKFDDSANKIFKL